MALFALGLLYNLKHQICNCPCGYRFLYHFLEQQACDKIGSPTSLHKRHSLSHWH